MPVFRVAGLPATVLTAGTAFHELEPVLERSLGPDWKRYLDDIDTERPLGTASVAQVYRVTLHDGSPGAIKVQRPRNPRDRPLGHGTAAPCGLPALGAMAVYLDHRRRR
ncbi:AarF/UbiB family protein [Streptomyces sp. NPDC058637]|uniref:AarF/UbiB family protein n=1 Tax=Streptomyces sp. NPDC058637 TaxID=3346569 RepID=UPI00364C5F6F